MQGNKIEIALMLVTMNKVQLKCRANYGLVGSLVIPFDVAKEAFGRMGHDVTDLGNGVLEYTIEVSEDHPAVQKMKEKQTVSMSMERAPC